MRDAGGHGAAAPAFALLESKLAAPAPRPGTVPRRRFLERMKERAGGAGVVSVVAPAGYGKTTAVSQWASRSRRPVVWLSLDRRDNDPAVLLGYLAAALETVPGLEPRIFDGVTLSGRSLWASALPRLCHAVAAVERPIAVILDDVHELSDRDAVDVLVAFARSVPHGSTLVLSGRAEARLPLARMRAAGELDELGPGDLGLDDEEALALLTRAGASVDEAQARELNRHAEGWAAGLYLAALAIRDDPGGDALARFAGDDRFVADYLRDECLSTLSPARVRFLTRTSVLERLSGPLCDAVLERSDSARTLASLERENSFVVPLDHHDEWYRYHHLFREMLAAELDRREPGLVAALHLRAAAWLRANGEPEAAVEHALAAGDLDSAARLVEGLAFPFYRTGRVSTVHAWFAAFDTSELLERYPAIAVLGTYVRALRGEVEDADRWAEAVARARTEAPMPDGSAFSAWRTATDALLARNGPERLRADAGRALEELVESSPFRPPTMLFAAIGELLCDEPVRAGAMLAEAAELAVATGATFAGVVAYSELALLALADERLQEADDRLERAWRLAASAPVGDYVPTAILLAASARLAMRRGDTDRARGLLASAQPLRPLLTHTIAWFSVQTLVELARVHLALADADGARLLLRDARSVLRLRPDLGVLGEHVDDLAAQLSSFSGPAAGWASTLTTAELRLLPLLTTHLTFREIAERLHVSRNTVKTQAISVYRKLDASSRSEAIDRARELGLIDVPIASR